MKIILDNVNYKGRHFKRVEMELMDVNNFEDAEGEIIEKIEGFLDEVIKKKDQG